MGSHHTPRRGFTLVELLAVVAIIVLLMGILFPALSAVRKNAKSAQSKATLSAITTGLETYKSDQKLGGEYPPSFSDAGVNQTSEGPCDYGKIVSPWIGGPGTPIKITGAGLLVLALEGPDQLGTAGFAWQGAVPSGLNTAPHWSNLTHKDDTTRPPGLYSFTLNKDNVRQPTYTRFGPYVDASKTKISAPKDPNAATPNFQLSNDQRQTPRDYPMFLDAFNQPFLYWKADTAGRLMADDTRANRTAGLRGIYHWEDNAQLVSSMNSSLGAGQPLDFVGNGGKHKLDWSNADLKGSVIGLPDGCFEKFVWNPTARAKYTPRQADSYIVVSPGIDGIYGTADDVANFDVMAGK